MRALWPALRFATRGFKPSLKAEPVGTPTYPPRNRGRVGGRRGGRDPQTQNIINGLRLPTQARNEDANDKAS